MNTKTAKKNHDYTFSGVKDKCLLCGDTKASHEPPPPEEERGQVKLMARMRTHPDPFGDWVPYEPPEESHVATLLFNGEISRVTLRFKTGEVVEYKKDGAL